MATGVGFHNDYMIGIRRRAIVICFQRCFVSVLAYWWNVCPQSGIVSKIKEVRIVKSLVNSTVIQAVYKESHLEIRRPGSWRSGSDLVIWIDLCKSDAVFLNRNAEMTLDPGIINLEIHYKRMGVPESYLDRTNRLHQSQLRLFNWCGLFCMSQGSRVRRTSGKNKALCFVT
jgi:hypothetical protein